ncbi:MAG: tetratricopeptide repeat protein [Acidobacteria bacterium]|nr:tetratricopeptide repeat protein [Acidobacteriota bacterium]
MRCCPSFLRGATRTRALTSLLAASLSVIPAHAVVPLPGSQDTAQRIARYQTTIANAADLKLTETQLGNLWAKMASAYQDLAQFTEAETAYTHALGLFERGHALESYAVTLGDLGSLYGMTGQLDAQENCRKRSLAIFEKLGEPLQIARAQAWLADGYLLMGKNKLAERYSAQAVHAMATLPDATDESRASAMVTFVYASCQNSHCGEGLRAAKLAMQIVGKNFDADSFASGQTHMALGFAEDRTGDRVDAEQDLREGLRVLRLDLPAGHPLLTNALTLYRDFLRENHRDAEAKRIGDEIEHRNGSAQTVSVYGLRRP